MGSELLIIRLRGPEAEWALAGDTGGLLEGPHTGLPEAEQAAGKRIMVLVPGDRVLLTQVTLPTRNRSKLLQAVPFAVEDQLAFEVESQHIAVGDQDETGQVPVAVAAREDMTRWCAMLDQAGLTPDALLPESLALTVAANEAAVLLEDGLATVRTTNAAFACAPDNLSAFWTALTDKPSHALAHDARSGSRAMPSLQNTELEPRPVNGSSLAVLAGGVGQSPMNLLQGEFSPRQRARTSMRLWRAAAALAAAWLLLTLAYGFTDYFSLRSQSEDLQRQIVQSFESVLPDTPLVNARVQLEQALSARGINETGLLQLLGHAASALHEQEDVRLQAMEYRDRTLMLRLEAPGIPALESLRSVLEADASLNTEMASVTATGSGVDGRLMISGQGG